MPSSIRSEHGGSPLCVLRARLGYVVCVCHEAAASGDYPTTLKHLAQCETARKILSLNRP